MSRYAVLALYPLWAVALLLAATAIRLGRASGRGLTALCFFLAMWVTGLILLETPAAAPIAERFVPAGILLAGAWTHAAADVGAAPGGRRVVIAYTLSSLVALHGLVAPRLLYGPGARSPGPLFVPIAVASAIGSAHLCFQLARSALASRGADRRRRGALAVGCVVGSFGGGGVILLRVYGLGDIAIAAPLLLVAVSLAAYAVLHREHGRARDVMVQGIAYAVITAALSAVGLTVYYHLLPSLTPDGGRAAVWLVVVTFFAALPLDPARMILVEQLGRRVFANPIGVRDLAEQVERTEVRADHAERLAEIGRMASAVAHEIRNPLGVIAAQAKLLERQGAKPETVASLRAQVDRAKRFLDDLLRYSKPRPLEIAEVVVLPVLSLVATSVRQIVGDGAPAIEVDADADLAIEVDRGALHDVTTALVHNAAIAQEGREGARVRVTAKRVEGAVEIAVEDDGVGVPREIEATLFQPFVTGRGRDAAHPGTGLGLAIAARWVERHGGSMRHERPVGGGARFVARWPRNRTGGGP